MKISDEDKVKEFHPSKGVGDDYTFLEICKMYFESLGAFLKLLFWTVIFLAIAFGYSYFFTEIAN